MSYTGEGFEGSCYNCGRDKIEVYQKMGAVGCSSCQAKYKREVAFEEKSNRPTLRDQFAMATLTGMIAKCGIDHAGTYAKIAYKAADAMLKAREE